MAAAVYFSGVAEASVFTVTTTNDSGAGSLRQAMIDALATSGNTIVFNFTSPPPFTINLTNALPVINNPLTIDGRTQSGYTNTPLVEINGTGAGIGAVGLQVNATACAIFALAINRFNSQGIVLVGVSNVIQGNFIGTDPSGNVPRGNGSYGIYVKSAGNTIGPSNVICANDTGIYVFNTSGDVIQGNWVGLGFRGTNALANLKNGILLDGSRNNQIGGTNAGTGNFISGNGQSGIYLNGATATGNVIQGNLIGTSVSGSLAVSNNGDGITLYGAPGNTIGPGNVISGNALSGVSLLGSAATTNIIIGNFIGTSATGKNALGNQFDGLYLTNASANQIGGTAAGAGNVISGNYQNGIILTGGANSNSVLGNLIGVAVGGTNALANRWDGLLISGGSANTIGGTKGGGNVISGNGTNGIFIGLTNDYFNTIVGNLIGTDLTGNKAVSNTNDGVIIRGCTNTVGGGNVISGNGQIGILLAGNNGSAAGNVVLGNFIGVDATGTNALGNGNAGVGVSGAANNSIGDGNVISGNGYAGLFLFGAGTTGNTIFGNDIGTDAGGAMAVPNSAGGIYAESVVSNTIGGTSAGARNVISGNLNSSGILLTNASGFSIFGNYIGLNAVGSAALKNWGGGITISRASLANSIGGSAAGARNVISGNNTYGVFVTGSAAQVVQGNYIGLDAGGSSAIGNSACGIYLQNSTNNFIGGASAGNVVSGNGGTGFPEIELSSSFGNTVQGNYVGLTAGGVSGLGPGTADGIYLLNSSSNLVGGAAGGAGNAIASNNVGIYFNNASWNSARGNLVGLAASGFGTPGNNNHNVQFDSGSTNNLLGGINAGEANRIAFAQTGFAGVRVRTNAFNNLISGNCIYSNGALGIDLGNAGVNPNIHLQTGVVGTNANRLQNYPVLTNAVSGTATLLRGSFDSALNKTYTLEFFASPVGDASGNGEGQLFLGQTNLVLGAVSPTNFSFVLPATVPAGWVVTATATDAANNTSEFSNWVTTSPVPLLQAARSFVAGQFTLSWTNIGGSYTLLQSSNLNPPQWTATGINSPTNGVYSIPVTTTNLEYFYRLQAQ